MGQTKKSVRDTEEVDFSEENIDKIEGLDEAWPFIEYIEL